MRSHKPADDHSDRRKGNALQCVFDGTQDDPFIQLYIVQRPVVNRKRLKLAREHRRTRVATLRRAPVAHKHIIVFHQAVVVQRYCEFSTSGRPIT